MKFKGNNWRKLPENVIKSDQQNLFLIISFVILILQERLCERFRITWGLPDRYFKESFFCILILQEGLYGRLKELGLFIPRLFYWFWIPLRVYRRYTQKYLK
jgi:hypothetical protein